MKYLLILTFLFAFNTGNAQLSVCVSNDSDPDGDGFGWENDSSCVVRNDLVCIDSPPIGDGWGWNGLNSCRVQTVDMQQDEDLACIDSGFTNCLVEAPPEEVDDPTCTDTTTGLTNCLPEVPLVDAECVDTPPFGDNWGWNGSGSCRLDGSEVVISNPDVLLGCFSSADALEAENQMLRAQITRMLSNQ